MRDYILLFVNGSEYSVSGDDVFLTLSQFLRIQLGLSGTKIVCSEGDCGSCTVLCGRPDADGAIEYLPIDSCIRFVFQLDGCHVVTVEGVSDEGALHGVQQAMIDCHGSQCGFCTPGFVVAMAGLLESSDELDEQHWRHGLSGNLCRCTGYSPILEAGKRAGSTKVRLMNERYQASALADAYENVRDELVTIHSSGRSVTCPTTVEEATKALAENPNARIVAGATDVGVQFNKGSTSSNAWIDLNRIESLKHLEVEAGAIVCGACATWADLEALTKIALPQFHKIISVFGSPQIRHVGTIGGNIINASPIADSLPVMFVCDAELEITGGSGSRTVPINGFYRGYKQFDLQPGEFLTRVRIPLPRDPGALRLYKVSRRRDMDISSFTAAMMVELAGDQIASAKIAYGAVGPVVLRLPQTEAFLVGKRFEEETFLLAGDFAVKEITPISDVRGSANFRLQLARNILLKYYHEACGSNASSAVGA